MCKVRRICFKTTMSESWLLETFTDKNLKNIQSPSSDSLVVYYLFATTMKGPRNYTHVSGSSYAKQCYSQITYMTHSHGYMYTREDPLSIHPLLLSLPSVFPFLAVQPLFFTYLEILLLLLVVRIHIHSCPWSAINCSPLAASPTPRHPTDQVTYLCT
jgi:hypothetical protein